MPASVPVTVAPPCPGPLAPGGAIAPASHPGGTLIVCDGCRLERSVNGREYRYRVVCLSCRFASPWCTNRPLWDDTRYRSWLTPRARAIRAADRHLRGGRSVNV